MEESLKATRFAHRLIVLVASAVLGFGLSVDTPKMDFQNALAEFLRINPALERIGELHSEQLNSFYEDNGTIGTIREAFRGLDTSDLKIVGVLADRFARPVYPADTEPPIEDIREYFFNKEQWEKLPAWHFDHASLRVALMEFRKANPDLSRITDVILSADRPDDWDGEPFQHHEWRASVAVELVRESGTEEILTVTQPGRAEVRHKGQENLEPKVANAFLREEGLVVGEGELKEALPRLRAVWDVVGLLDVGVIRSTLERQVRQEKSRHELSIGGIRIGATIAFLLAPAILATLLLYLLANVKHLASIPEEEPGQFARFPWMGAFESLIGRVLMVASTMVLPVAAVSVVVARSGLGVMPKLILIVAYLAVLETLGLSVLRASERLRRQNEPHLTNQIRGPAKPAADC